jgi:hypothetical protein
LLPAWRFNDASEAVFVPGRPGVDAVPSVRLVVVDDGGDTRGALEVLGPGQLQSPRIAPALNAEGLSLRARVRSLPASEARLFAKDANFNYSGSAPQQTHAAWTELRYILGKPHEASDDYKSTSISFLGVIANQDIERWYLDALWVQPLTVDFDFEAELDTLRYEADEVKLTWLGDPDATCGSADGVAGSVEIEGEGTVGRAFIRPLGIGSLVVVARLRSRGASDHAELYVRDDTGHEASSPVTLLSVEQWRRLELDLTRPPNADLEFDSSRVIEVGVRVMGKIELDCLDYDVELAHRP